MINFKFWFIFLLIFLNSKLMAYTPMKMFVEKVEIFCEYAVLTVIIDGENERRDLVYMDLDKAVAILNNSTYIGHIDLDLEIVPYIDLKQQSYTKIFLNDETVWVRRYENELEPVGWQLSTKNKKEPELIEFFMQLSFEIRLY